MEPNVRNKDYPDTDLFRKGDQVKGHREGSNGRCFIGTVVGFSNNNNIVYVDLRDTTIRRHVSCNKRSDGTYGSEGSLGFLENLSTKEKAGPEVLELDRCYTHFSIGDVVEGMFDKGGLGKCFNGIVTRVVRDDNGTAQTVEVKFRDSEGEMRTNWSCDSRMCGGFGSDIRAGILINRSIKPRLSDRGIIFEVGDHVQGTKDSDDNGCEFTGTVVELGIDVGELRRVYVTYTCPTSGHIFKRWSCTKRGVGFGSDMSRGYLINLTKLNKSQKQGDSTMPTLANKLAESKMTENQRVLRNNCIVDTNGEITQEGIKLVSQMFLEKNTDEVVSTVKSLLPPPETAHPQL